MWFREGMDDEWMWFEEWMGGWIDVVWRMDAWIWFG